MEETSGWLPVVQWQIGGQGVVVLGFTVGRDGERKRKHWAGMAAVV